MRQLLHKIKPKGSAKVTQQQHVTDSLASSRIQYGQQCSPNCGCIVRFEASITKQHTIKTISYSAKQIVMHQNSNTPIRCTTKGQRLQTKECQCQTLHYLSQALVEHATYNTTPLHRVKNSMEFYANRSSTGFRQTVLKVQGLNASDTHCFDVVEEAWTAAMKGYLPKQRNTTTTTPNRLPDLIDPVHFPEPVREADWTTTQQQQHHHLPWNQVSMQPKILDLSSALYMWDLNLEEERTTEAPPKKKNVPTDWVSFVDEIYQDESVVG